MKKRVVIQFAKGLIGLIFVAKVGLAQEQDNTPSGTELIVVAVQPLAEAVPLGPLGDANSPTSSFGDKDTVVIDGTYQSETKPPAIDGATTANTYNQSTLKGIHHRRVMQTVMTNGVELFLGSTNAQGVVLENNMHYVDETGDLRASNPVIEVHPDGATVSQTGMKIRFAPDINVSGAIEMRTPGNIRLRGTPLGISYYDANSGESVMLAELKSSKALVAAPDKLVYQDIFDDVAADALYEVTKSGVMQTIIIKEDLPPPSAFGLSDDSTRLEVLTEFTAAPQPVKKQRVLKREMDPARRVAMAAPDFTDTDLEFGDSHMPAGFAFALDADAGVEDELKRQPVGKHWQEIPGEGRSILFESVEYAPAKATLNRLPKSNKQPGRTASSHRTFPSKRLAAAARTPVQVASIAYKAVGFAVDYNVQLANISSIVFYSATTYLISGSSPTVSQTVTVSGPATFQAGAIIKYHPKKSLRVLGNTSFLGTSVNPTIFTSYNDNTYGEPIHAETGGFPASNGNPAGQYYADRILELAHFSDVRNVKMFYAIDGLHLTSPPTGYRHFVSDSSFQSCARGINLNQSASSLAADLKNLEFCSVEAPNGYHVSYGSQPTVSGLWNYCDLEVPKASITASASSSTVGWGPGLGINGTIEEPTWHSENSSANQFAYPQWLRLDLGSPKSVSKVIYRPRNTAVEGTFTSYRIFVTDNSGNDPAAWGTPITGTWNDWVQSGGKITSQHKEVRFTPRSGRYVIFVCDNSLVGWASAGEVWVFQTQTVAPTATPDIYPPAGTYPTPARIRINCATAGTTIWYTTDGSNPTQGTGTSQLYTGPFALPGTGTREVRARAFSSTTAPSAIRVNSFILTQPAANQYQDITFHQMDATVSDASSYTAGWEPARAINGTAAEPGWHSENSPENQFAHPQWFRVDFGAGFERTVGRIKYKPRGTHRHGTFTKYEIFVTSSPSNSAADWGTPQAGLWSWQPNWPTAEEQVVDVVPPRVGRYVIFRCLQSLEGWASAGEVWVYQTAMPNAPPTITPIADLTMAANTSSEPISFIIGDAESSAANLTLTGSSANQTLLPNTGIKFAGSGANRTVTLTPAANQEGTANVTLTVTDQGGLTSIASFVVTVRGPVVIVPGQLDYQENDEKFVFLAVGSNPSTSGRVTDRTGLPNYENGFLKVYFYGGVSPSSDQLGIYLGANGAPNGAGNGYAAFSSAGDQLLLNGIAVGTIFGASISGKPREIWWGSGSALQINFNANASVETADALLKNVLYRNTSDAPAPGSRIIRTVISNGRASSDESAAPTSINVIPVNDPPWAYHMVFFTTPGTAITIPLKAGDIENTDSTLLTYATTQPAYGNLTGSGNSRTYTPPNPASGASSVGVGSFTFTVTDLDPLPTRLSASGSVTVYVGQDGAPMVNAGPDQTIWQGGGCFLSGWPSVGGNLKWSVVSGPAPLEFKGPPPNYPATPPPDTRADPTVVGFALPGIYTLRLSLMSGSTAIATDDMAITVLENSPPLADAGPDRLIAKNVPLTITANASDDWTPAGSLLNQWYLFRAPDGYPINPPPPSGLALQLPGFTQAGTYIFRFSSRDEQLDVGTDEVVVRVVDANALQGRTWTRNADFEEGQLFGVSYEIKADALSVEDLNGRPRSPDALGVLMEWATAEDFPVVLRMHPETGEILGSFAGAPQLLDPSTKHHAAFRIASDSFGNLWVNSIGLAGNPQSHSPILTRIGLVLGGKRFVQPGVEGPGNYLTPPFKYNTALDRRDAAGSPAADGFIHTLTRSGAWLTWPGGAPATDLERSASDESIVASIADTSNSSGSFAWTLIPSDPGQSVWRSTYGLPHLARFSWDALGNTIVQNASISCGDENYESVLDDMGRLWMMANGSLVYWLNGECTSISMPPEVFHAWRPLLWHPVNREVWYLTRGPLGTSKELVRYNPSTGAATRKPAPYFAESAIDVRALTAAPDGTVWALKDWQGGSAALVRLSSEGNVLGEISLPCLNRIIAISVDRRGRVWVGGEQADDLDIPVLIGIEPTSVDVLNQNRPAGRIAKMHRLPRYLGSSPDPANIADLTAGPELLAPVSSGTWTVIHNGGVTDQEWGKVRWTGQGVAVHVRAANTVPELARKTFLPAANNPQNEDLNSHKGQYIEIRATITSSGSTVGVLEDLSLAPRGIDLLDRENPYEFAREDEITIDRTVVTTAGTLIGGASNLDVLANDRGGLNSITEVSAPRRGSARIVMFQNRPHIEYTGPPNFFGEDRLVYTAVRAAEGGVRERAIVRVRVGGSANPQLVPGPPGAGAGDFEVEQFLTTFGPAQGAICEPSPVPDNSPPIAGRDGQSIPMRVNELTTTEYPINVLKNDWDTEVERASLRIVGDYPRRTTFGRVRKVMVGGVEHLSYLPDVRAGGTDRFTYTISDIHGAEAVGVVVMRVAPLIPPGIEFALPADNAVFTSLPISLTANVTLGTVDYSVVGTDFFEGLATGALFEQLSGPTPSEIHPPIVRVEYFADGRKIGETGSSANNWQVLWNSAPNGTFGLTAEVTDAAGSVGYSLPRQITILRQGVPPHPASARLTRINQQRFVSSVYDPSDPNHPPEGNDPTGYPLIRDARVSVEGFAESPQAAQVKYQLSLWKLDGKFVANVTPGAGADGFAAGPKTGDPEIGGVLGQIDLSGVANGPYDLELLVSNGFQEARDRARFLLDSQLKLGIFKFQEVDHLASTAGLPLTVIRSYDSSSLIDGDFGVGWSSALNELDVEFSEDRALLKETDGDETVDARIGGGRDVTLTLPDGRRTTYRFKVTPMPSLFFGYAAEWDAAPGITAKLSTPTVGSGETPGKNTIFSLWGGITYWQYGGPQTPFENYDIPELLLTLQDGTKYEITRDNLGGHFTQTRPEKPFYTHSYGKARVSRIERPNGEALVITTNGIDHFTPRGQRTRSLFFERGAGYRIVAVRDEATQAQSAPPLVRYEYDANGNLVRVHKLVDAAKGINEITTYVYGKPGFPHYITKIVDPRGVEVARNTYYASGKLESIKSSDDRLTKFNYDASVSVVPGPDPNHVAVARQIITEFPPGLDGSNEALQTAQTFFEADTRGNVLLEVRGKSLTTASPVIFSKTERWFDSKDNLTKETVRALSGGDDLTTVYDPKYEDADSPERVTSRTVTRPGEVTTREEFNDRGDVSFTVDANNYVFNEPADSPSVLFYNEFEYERGSLSKTIARSRLEPLSNPPGSTLLSEHKYYASGHVMEGLPQETYDALGHRSRYVYYEASGNDGRMGDLKEVVGEQKNADGSFTEMTRTFYKYDPATGNRKEEIQKKRVDGTWTDWAVTKYEYDARNRLTRTTDAVGGVATTVYNAGGQVAYSTDRYGATTHYIYDAMGRVVQTEFPDKSISRAATAYLASPIAPFPVVRQEIRTDRHFKEDPSNAISGTRTIFDELGRPVRTERVSNVNISFQSLNGEIGKTTFNSATVLSYTEQRYDFAGRVFMSRDANGKWTKYDFDEAGRQWRVRQFVDASGNDIANVTVTTLQDYDKNGNVAWTLDANQHAAIGSLTGDSAAVKETVVNNHLGRVTKFEYDNFNRQTKTILPDDATTDVNTDNPVTKAGYDVAGRKWMEIDADGKGTAFVHDALGRLSWVITDVAAAVTTLPNPLHTTAAQWETWAKGARSASDSTATQYKYDDVGNLEEQKDARGNATKFEYDKLGRRTKRTLPSAAFEAWVHDFNGTISDPGPTKPSAVQHLDFKSQKVLKIQDVMGRLVEQKENGVSRLTLKYAPNGQRSQMVDNKGTSEERTTDYAYDTAGLLKVRKSLEGTLVYVYDLAGNVTAITARHSYTFAGERPWLYNGSVVGVNTRPSGARMDYIYDSRNRLQQVWSDITRVTYGYDPAGNLKSGTYGNSVVNTHEYNARHQLRFRKAMHGATLLASFDYDDYDAGDGMTWPGSRRLTSAGLRRGLRENVPAAGATRLIGYSYDGLNRVIREELYSGAWASVSDSALYDTAAGYGDTLGYDKTGNRGQRTTYAGVPGRSYAPYDANDRLGNGASPLAGKVSARFDANGNTLQFDLNPGDPGDTGWDQASVDTYDFENRLTGAVRAAGTIAIVYDGDGNRVKKTVGGIATYYLVDDRNPTGYAQVLEEQPTPGGSPTVRYVYGQDLIFQDRAGTVHYFGYDGLGSVRYLTTAAATPVVSDTYTYDTFGLHTASTGATVNNYRFTGEQWDPHLGMYYLRARYYHPDLGRFWTADTFEGNQSDPLSLHKYLYCAADPVNNTDPSGMAVEFDAGKGKLVHEEFYPFALAALGATKWKDTAIGTAVPSLAGRPGSNLRPDIIVNEGPMKVWYELKPISHKNSKLTEGTGETLLNYGTLLAQAGIQPGIPQLLVPFNRRLGTIVDPIDRQRLDVWLEAGDVPGLIYYYFNPSRDGEDLEGGPVFVGVPVVNPEYNSASRAVGLVGGRAAIAARNASIGALTGIGLYVGVAAWNASQGAY